MEANLHADKINEQIHSIPERNKKLAGILRDKNKGVFKIGKSS